MPPSQQSRIGGRAIQQIGGTRKASTLVVAPFCATALLHHGIVSMGSTAPRTSLRRARRNFCMMRLASTLRAWL